MGVIFHPLSKRIGNLVKPDEFTDFLHLRMITRRRGVKSGDNGGNVTKYGSVKKSWKRDGILGYAPRWV